jgi:hypothetical protein
MRGLLDSLWRPPDASNHQPASIFGKGRDHRPLQEQKKTYQTAAADVARFTSFTCIIDDRPEHPDPPNGCFWCFMGFLVLAAAEVAVAAISRCMF